MTVSLRTKSKYLGLMTFLLLVFYMVLYGTDLLLYYYLMIGLRKRSSYLNSYTNTIYIYSELYGIPIPTAKFVNEKLHVTAMGALILYITYAAVFFTSIESVVSLKPKEVSLYYPVKVLFSHNIQDYTANATGDSLVCFQNREYEVPTVLQSFLCLFPISLPFADVKCGSVWGSRTLVVRHEGDMEFLKVAQSPSETFLSIADPIIVVATRWMEFQSNKDNWIDPHWIADEYGGRHMTQIPAEPITICSRSTNPYGEGYYFHASFRNAYIRERDRRNVLQKLGYHTLLLIAASSVWFLPYLVAFAVAIYSFLHGLKVIMALLGTGTVILCLTPLMLTKKNRQLATVYLNYYFNQAQATEAKQILRSKKPLFHAIFFSSLLLCSGSAAVYMLYHYSVLDRELRNSLLRINIGISLSWFAFFVCRSFERFFSDWVWVIMSLMVSHFAEKHSNPLAHTPMQIVVCLFSGLFSYFLRQLWRKGDFQLGIDQFILPPLQNFLRSFGWKIHASKSMTSFSITNSSNVSADNPNQ